MVPIHPQPDPGHPDQLRWIIPAGLLTCTGRLVSVPAPLATMLADGTLTEITAQPNAVLTRLGPGRSWPVEGPRVRTALHTALDHPDEWLPAHAATPDVADAALYGAARDLLAGPVGQYARSHGGSIELLDVHDGVVTVRLGGACHGCPAARFTVHQRLEDQLRRRYPSLQEVRDTGS